MTKITFLLICNFALSQFVSAQLFPYNPRKWDTNWTQTKFSEYFDEGTLNSAIWRATNNTSRGSGALIDSSGVTYSIDANNNYLRLSMLYYPDYCFIDYKGEVKCHDYISGEICSRESYKYGIYEGRMKFATGSGSWPAFWLWGNEGAEDPQLDVANASEIDIAELNWRKNILGNSSATTDHVIHWWWPEEDYGTSQMAIPGGEYYNDIDWNSWHTFKFIYTPYDLKFYIDDNDNPSWQRSRFYRYDNEPVDVFVENFEDNIYYFEYVWFPKHEVKIILSQQVANEDKLDCNIVHPQTSLFDWVTFKEFFLAPEITCPDIICSTTNATLDVDEAATNITWTLSSNFGVFSGNLSGTGKTVTITPSTINHGTGKIIFNFDMPSEESFSIEKEIRVNGPGYEDVYLDICTASGESVPKSGGHYLLCPNTHYHITLMNDFGACSLSDYNWSALPSGWSVNYYYNNMISIYTNSVPGGMIEVEATTCCGMNTKVLTDYVGQYYNCGSYSMLISPNPTTTETTVSLETTSEEIVFDENTEWELVIYDQSQLEKEKKTKIKGGKVKIKTSGWKKGIYFVRVKYKDEILTGKLSVGK